MANFARIAVRSPQPFDIVGDNFSLCGLGRANEGVLGKAVLKELGHGGDGSFVVLSGGGSLPVSAR